MSGKINALGNAQLVFQRPGEIAVLGFEFREGQKVTALVFDFLAFDELLAKVPYPFIRHGGGIFVLRPIKSVLCI